MIPSIGRYSNWSSHTLLVEMQGGTATLENSLAVSYKLNVYLLHDPTVPLLAVYPRKMKTYVYITLVF